MDGTCRISALVWIHVYGVSLTGTRGWFAKKLPDSASKKEETVRARRLVGSFFCLCLAHIAVKKTGPDNTKVLPGPFVL